MKETPEERRRRENAELIQRMNAGDNLCHTDLGAFRWQPRPAVKKDKREIARVFGEDES